MNKEELIAKLYAEEKWVFKYPKINKDMLLKDWIFEQLVYFGDSWEDIIYHNIPEEKLLMDMDCTTGLIMDNYLLWSADRVYCVDENEYRIFGYQLKWLPRNPVEKQND